MQIAQFTGLNRNTVNRLLGCLRERKAQACELELPLPPKPDPATMRVPMGRGSARETLDPEANKALGETDREHAA